MNKREELKQMLASVDLLAREMKDKLHEKARKGYAGGLRPTKVVMSDLGRMLLEHAERGTGVCPHCKALDGGTDDYEARQMIDVCNLAMMIWVQAGRPT